MQSPPQSTEVLIVAKDLLFSTLAPEFAKQLKAHRNDPTPVVKPDCGIDHWHIRILPNSKPSLIPHRFWTSNWCFYEMGIGPNGGGGLETATCAFMWAPNQEKQGGGAYGRRVTEILEQTETASKGLFRIRWNGASQLLCYSFRGHLNADPIAAQMKWLIEHTLKRFQAIPSL